MDETTEQRLLEFLEAGTAYFKRRLELLEAAAGPLLKERATTPTPGPEPASTGVTEAPTTKTTSSSPPPPEVPKRGTVYRLPVKNKKPQLPAAGHEARVRKLLGLISSHKRELEESIREMGCGGRCEACPHPDKPDAVSQVVECLNAVESALKG